MNPLIKIAEELKSKLQDMLNHLYKEEQAKKDARMEAFKRGEQYFTDEELRYAAIARCPCGHGMAYPKDGFSTMHGYWDCSAIWKGCADPDVKHESQLPFAFYEIKSEDQPSAHGATTRRLPE